MLIREKDGFYAGQVREFPSHIALELIASGRAENPFAEPASPAVVEETPVAVVGTSQVGSTKPGKKKAR
jgi:hypothetical protein